MFDSVEVGVVGKYLVGENVVDFVVEGDFVDFDKVVNFLCFGIVM